MEEIIDFDEWLANYKPQSPTYVAVYDPNTYAVKSVGPSHAFENEKYKISLDSNTAEAIINGEIKISSCVIDIESNSIEIAEIKNVFKIDDVLHRVISKKYSTIEKNDIYLTYSSKKKTLKIELSSEFGGTKKIKGSTNSRKIIWDGDTEMNFLITEYNDPNLFFEMFSVKISKLVGKSVTFENIDYDNFSVYTRRIFKNYVINYR